MSVELSGFPTLKPAIITKVDIGDVHDLGKSATSPSATLKLLLTTGRTGTIHNGSKLSHYVSLGYLLAW